MMNERVVPDIVLSDQNVNLINGVYVSQGGFALTYKYKERLSRLSYIVKFLYPNEKAKVVYDSEINSLLAIYEKLLNNYDYNRNVCPKQILCYKYEFTIDPIKQKDDYKLIYNQMLHYHSEGIDQNYPIYGIVSEYINGDNLYKHVTEYELEPEEIVNFSNQLTSIVKRLHDVDVVHRDIKLENIIVGYNIANKSDELYLIDFGFACLINECSGTRGTLRYFPSLMIQYKTNTNDIKFYKYQDVFAVMVCIWVMEEFKYPFDVNNNQVSNKLNRIEYYKEGLSNVLLEFFHDYLGKSPEYNIEKYTIDNVRKMFKF